MIITFYLSIPALLKKLIQYSIMQYSVLEFTATIQ